MFWTTVVGWGIIVEPISVLQHISALSHKLWSPGHVSYVIIWYSELIFVHTKLLHAPGHRFIHGNTGFR